MKNPQDRYVSVGETNARYWAAGEKGSPVILIHGMGMYIDYWASVIHALADHHQVYAVDLPGHGKTDKPVEISNSFDDLSRFISDFMTAIGIRKAHIIGHSMGGGAVLRLATRRPDAVDRIVLVESAGFGREIGMIFRISSLPILGEVITRPSRFNARTLLRMFVYDPAAITDEIVDTHYRMTALPGAQRCLLKTLRTYINIFGGKGNNPDMQLLPSIQKPVFVIWGRQDGVIPAAHADAAARGFPDVRVHIIENCGHIPMYEHPSEFSSLLVDFLME